MPFLSRAAGVLLLLVLPGAAAWGQVDLQLQSASTGSVVTQTRLQTLTLTVVNRGPGTLASIVVETVRPVDTTLVAVDFLPGCTVAPSGSPNARSFSWLVGSLPDGGTRSCSASIRALPTAPNFELRLGFSTGAPGNIDPQPSDNLGGWAFLISATDIMIDLDVSVTRSPIGVMPPGSSGTLTTTVRNLGRDAAPNITATTDFFYISGGATELYDILLTPTGATSCTVFADDIGFARSLIMQFGTLPPGGSVSCTLGVIVTPYASNPRNFGVTANYSGYGVWDDNPVNNRAMVGFQFFPPVIPTLSPLGLVLLAGFMLGLVVWHRRTGSCRG